jgi:predicted hydrocarbon binding protein
MTDTYFSPNMMRSFVQALSLEIGHDTFSASLSNAGLPAEWADPAHFTALNGVQTAQAYARLQSALRTYYGRGARGIFLRISAKLWDLLLEDASFGVKAQSVFVRGLPKSMRRKPALDLLARILSDGHGTVTAHTLDLDLILVDRESPTTLGQSDQAPICYVTLGLIRDCLHWADGQVYDIEERACRATGAKQCEFKVTVGG